MNEINTDKNVYVLGAGFSKEIGLPLQDDFLLVAKEVYFTNPSKYKHFENVFRYQDKMSKMRKFLNYPLLNLEHLFNLIEMGNFYSGNRKISQIKRDFTQLICDVLIEKTPHPFTHSSTGHLKMDRSYEKYFPFIRLLIKDDKYDLITYDDTIISFNYDLVIEGLASIYNWRRGENTPPFQTRKNNFIKLNTIFGKSNISVDEISKYYSKNREDSYFPPSQLFSEELSAIKLLKLHGSINWKTVDKKTFIVPPTWNKSDRQVKKLWDIAYKELMLAERIIFIGYSFPETDTYVKSLLALSLNENKRLQHIYFVNPDKDVAKNACLSLLDKHFEKYCSYKEWKFTEFISSVDGKSFIRESLNRRID